MIGFMSFILYLRKARIDAPGSLHHIIVRGIERKAILKDRHDRENFLGRFGVLEGHRMLLFL